MLARFADGVGLHVYSDDPGALLPHFAGLAHPGRKLLWITEWGYLKNGDHEKDDPRRTRMNEFIRQATALKAPHVEKWFYYSYNDSWGLVTPMSPTSDPSVPGAVFDSAHKVFRDYVH